MKNIIIIILFILSFNNNIQASHALGGDISYTDMGNGNYEVVFTFYRDCYGIDAPNSVSISISSASVNFSSSSTLSKDSSATEMLEISCPSVQNSCQGGTLLGIEKYIYRKIITLPAVASDWNFKVDINARSAAITNVINPDMTTMTLEANLNNLAATINNSPVFSNDPEAQLTIGNTHIINNGIYDPDGDSLVISFTPAMDDNLVLTYDTPYTFNTPISSATPIILDPSNGDLIVTPTMVETDVVVFLVEEYRNGLIIGSTKREMAINIYPGTNNLPTINYTFPFVATACYNDTINLNIITFDADASDSVFIDSIYSNLPVGYFNYTVIPGMKQMAHLQFYPDSTLISSHPYIFSIKVRDNDCPFFGIQYYSFRLYTNACGTFVWPGDADSDLDADMYDVLPIGIGYNATGPIRNAASNNWIGQPGTLWTQSFLSGVNYMHADCNGDGTIDSTDLQAININYGLSHPLRLSSQPELPSTLSDASLYLTASVDSIAPGSSVTIDINFGNSTTPITNLYGLAFRVSFDPQIFDQGGIQFFNSWIGNMNDLLLFKKANLSQGFIDVVISRINGTNIIGGGVIAQLNFHSRHTSPAGFTTLTLSGLKAISANENILSTSMQGDSVMISSNTTGIVNGNSSRLNIFPNPVKSGNPIYINKNSFSHIRIYNACGNTVFEKDSQIDDIIIDSQIFKPGLYFLELRNEKNAMTGKLLVY